MGQIGLVTEVVEIDEATWIASAGTKLSCVNEFPGEETKYLTGTVDCQTSFKFEDVVKGDSETAVLVIRARFNGVVGGVGLNVRCFADPSDILTEIADPVGTGTNAVDFNDEWCIVYKVIHPDVWAEFDPASSGFSITKPDDGLDSTDIAWIRLLVQDQSVAEFGPTMLLDCRAAVTLSTGLRQQEIDAACGIGYGARFGLGSYDGSSIRRGPNDTPASSYNWSNLDDITDRLIAATDLEGNERPGYSLLIIGTDAPNWTAYKNAVGGTWGNEANRPPPEAWSYWAADAQAAVDHVIAEYEAAGLDPLEYCLFQIANEVDIGGAGGPWATAGPFVYEGAYSTLYNSGAGDGKHDGPSNLGDRRNVADQLAYLVSNVNFRGCRVLGVAHESAIGDVAFTNEVETMDQIVAHLPAVNRPAMNFYVNVSNGWTLAERGRFVKYYYDLLMTARDTIAARIETLLPGIGWADMPWALTEFGGTLTKCGMNGSAMPQFGHAKRGEYIAALAERLLNSGAWEIISLYATRERSVVTDANLFGLMKSDGTYSLAYRSVVKRLTGLPATDPPSGSYSTATGETAGIG